MKSATKRTERAFSAGKRFVTKDFDPFDKLSIRTSNENGFNEMMFKPLLTRSGSLCVSSSGQGLFVPSMYLSMNAYREWLLAIFPEAKIVPAFQQKVLPTSPVPSADGTMHYPAVEFWLNIIVDGEVKATGIGVSKYDEDNPMNSMRFAYADAFKNAMKNMGFGVDLDWDALLEELPVYVGTDIGIVPYSGDVYSEGKVIRHVDKENTETMVHTDEEETGGSDLKKQSVAVEKPKRTRRKQAKKTEAEADTKKESSVAKESATVEKHADAAPGKTKTSTSPKRKSSDERLKDFLRKKQTTESESSEAKKTEVLDGQVTLDIPESDKSESIYRDELAEALTEQSSDDAVDPGEVVFVTLDAATKELKKESGKKMGKLPDSLIELLASDSLPDNFVPPMIVDAAKKLNAEKSKK